MKKPKVSRRSVLKAAAGVAGAGLLGGAGRAQQSQYHKSPFLLGPARGNRVVIVGGGWGGVTTARTLKKINPKIDVVLIEAKEVFMSCPLSNLYLAGLKDLHFLTFDYANLVKEGIHFVNERALDVDRDRKRVYTTGGTVAYDYLVLSPGIEYVYDEVPGFEPFRAHMPVGFRPFEHVALRRNIEQFKGGDFILSVPRGPYRCPPGPYERAAMIAWYFKEHKIPGKVILLAPSSKPPKAKGFLAAYDDLYADHIEYYPNTETLGVDYEKKVVQTSLGEFDFDYANIIPPMRAGEIVRKAGVGDRWVDVELPWHQTKVDPDVYVLGDADSAGGPKSGKLAFEEGRYRVAVHIAARIAGQEAELKTPDVRNICYSFVDDEEAIWIAARYNFDEANRRRKALESKLDVQRSAKNGERAYDWAAEHWGYMFGD